MNELDKLGWEILNVTADDCENLEQIYLQLSYSRKPISESSNHPWEYDFRPVHNAPLLYEIGNRIRDLVEAGCLHVKMDEDGRPWKDHGDFSYVWRAWFDMTPQGRSVWQAQESGMPIQ